MFKPVIGLTESPRRSRMPTWLKCLVATFFLTLTQSALALKVETHIWIAQDIVNELEERPTFSFVDSTGKRVGTVNVPAKVRAAILQHKEAFLLGSIGPDAFPGIFEGQMTIHPGSKHHGWGSDNWLRHLLLTASTDEELAFAYGSLTHGAADIFAHTYVNTYAGDVWDLSDGEIDVERRHFLIEGYIASKMPQLSDKNGYPMHLPHQLIMKNGEMSVPTSLLYRAYIQDTIAANEMGANGSPHFKQIMKLRYELQDLVKDGGTLQRLHELSQKVLAYYFFEIEVSNEDLRKFNEAHQKLRDAVNNGIDEVQGAHNGFRNLVLKGIDGSSKADIDAQTSALDFAMSAYGAIQDLENQKREVEDDIARILDDLNPLIDQENRCKKVCDIPPCKDLGHGFYVPSGCNRVRDSCKQACTIASAASLKNVLAAKRKLQGDINKKIVDTKNNYLDAISKVYEFTRKAYVAEGELINFSIDLAQRTAQSIDPVKSLVLGWIDDIELAMGEYFTANGTAIRNTMIGVNPLDPLLRWKDCSFPLILGIPSEVVGGACAVEDVASSLKELISFLESLAAKSTPFVGELLGVKQELELTIRTAASEELVRFGSKATGTDIQALLDVLKEPATAQMVDSQFMHSPASKKLIAFENASRRLNSDMKLGRNGNPQTLDLDGFAMIYDARVLARLALLDASSINRLFGENILDSNDNATSLLDRFAHSIDGNHQWMALAPPDARTGGSKHACGALNGYPDFPLWEPQSRRAIFKRMFKGPLAPAIETPYEVGFLPVRPPNYPYVPSKEHPFPNWTIAVDSCVQE